MLIKQNPTKTRSWEALARHFELVKDKSLLSYFKDSPSRFDDFSIAFEDIFVDYSKNHISKETMKLFLDFADEMNLQDGIKAMFSGKEINETESRSVLHIALRSTNTSPIFIDGEDVKPKVKQVLAQMKNYADKFHNNKCLGFSQKPLKKTEFLDVLV